MKSGISADLLDHCTQVTASLTACMAITRTDSSVRRFTIHDKDIVRSEGTYQSASGYVSTAVSNNASLSVPNLEAFGHLASAGMDINDIRNGLYDFARVEVFLCNWARPDSGKIRLPGAYLGSINTADEFSFRAEIRGLMQVMQNKVGRTVGPSCDNELYDSKCGVTKSLYLTSGRVVTAVTNNRLFEIANTGKATGYFNAGEVIFTSGLNNTRRMEVAIMTAAATDSIQLFHPMPQAIAVGDTFDIYAGCNKTRSDCKTKFILDDANGNVINMAAFPDAPGRDEALKFGGQ